MNTSSSLGFYKILYNKTELEAELRFFLTNFGIVENKTGCVNSAWVQKRKSVSIENSWPKVCS